MARAREIEEAGAELRKLLEAGPDRGHGISDWQLRHGYLGKSAIESIAVDAAVGLARRGDVGGLTRIFPVMSTTLSNYTAVFDAAVAAGQVVVMELIYRYFGGIPPGARAECHGEHRAAVEAKLAEWRAHPIDDAEELETDRASAKEDLINILVTSASTKVKHWRWRWSAASDLSEDELTSMICTAILAAAHRGDCETLIHALPAVDKASTKLDGAFSGAVAAGQMGAMVLIHEYTGRVPPGVDACIGTKNRVAIKAILDAWRAPA